MHERFLARLANSRFAEQLVLGGMLLAAERRPAAGTVLSEHQRGGDGAAHILRSPAAIPGVRIPRDD